eukprot:GHVP01066925.1.p1 GENE.GHVP01066925.1~~GHVP01066925.1.p1  ORF type:complete len:159 (+),score=31.61 GHVP01066925.1:653-1129(+)
MNPESLKINPTKKYLQSQFFKPFAAKSEEPLLSETSSDTSEKHTSEPRVRRPRAFSTILPHRVNPLDDELKVQEFSFRRSEDFSNSNSNFAPLAEQKPAAGLKAPPSSSSLCISESAWLCAYTGTPVPGILVLEDTHVHFKPHHSFRMSGRQVPFFFR